MDKSKEMQQRIRNHFKEKYLGPDAYSRAAEKIIDFSEALQSGERLGRFRASIQMAKDGQGLGPFGILLADPVGSHEIEYLAVSPLFQKVHDPNEVPFYEIDITEDRAGNKTYQAKAFNDSTGEDDGGLRIPDYLQEYFRNRAVSGDEAAESLQDVMKRLRAERHEWSTLDGQDHVYDEQPDGLQLVRWADKLIHNAIVKGRKPTQWILGRAVVDAIKDFYDGDLISDYGCSGEQTFQGYPFVIDNTNMQRLELIS